MNRAIRIKPHHLLDIITSFGAGKLKFEPHPYGHAVHAVAAAVLSDRDALLEIELGADDICQPCRHNAKGLCDDTMDTSFRPAAPPSKREWNLIIDRRWCERLTACEFCQRARDLAGDLADIYREEPAPRTADRARNLAAGLQKFLNA